MKNTNENLIWYDRPAENWNEAIPLGNGIMAAMVFGGIEREQIQINEETLWSGYPKYCENPQLAEHLGDMRRLIFDGKYSEAEALCFKYMTCSGNGSHSVGDGEHYGSYQTAGEVYITKSKPYGDISGYHRSLDIFRGVSVCKCASFRREYFVSSKYNTIICRITGDIDGISVNYTREKCSIVQEGDTITAYGEQPSGPHGEKGLCWGAAVKTVKGSDSVTVYISAATTMFEKDDPTKRSLARVNEASSVQYDEILCEHIKQFSGVMNRVSLSLPYDDTMDNIPTDKRLLNPDDGLAALYFQFGRYLLVSSSRGYLPANLQGIWCKDYNAIWSSDYHININIQMNYWPCEVTNLSEYGEPFFRYIKMLADKGSVTAGDTYKMHGWVAHTVTNPWGFTAPGEHPSWGAFTCAGAWCCRHLWEHYLYTGDVDFLREYYPVIKGAAEFFMDFLVEEPHTGYLVTAPSNSPENRFKDPKTGEDISMCAGPTMDACILYELFTIVAKCSEILCTDTEFAQSALEYRKKLPPIRIGKHGQMMEWLYDYDETEPGHRHISNLYALHPSDRITPDGTPELAHACAVTLERRLSCGGGHTGWSRAWIINFFARLAMGDKAYDNLYALLRGSTLPNMLDNHPPFQIDGNFGGTAGIAEMLLQSHGENTELLPALPERWKSGEFKGLVARGGFVFDAVWKDSVVVSCNVFSRLGGKLKVRINGDMLSVDTAAGQTYTLI